MSGAAPAAMLEVRGLHVSYGKARAVQGVSLRVEEGEIVALIGANGAGKSSTMHAICGAARPALGAVTFRGKDITGLPPHRVVPLGIAQVPEGRLIFDDLTVEENLVLGGIARPERSGRRRMAEVLDLFPVLAPRTGEPASNLSGGQQQLLAIARGLMSSPAFLMLDEPSLGLAPLAAQEVFDLFTTLRRSGVTILLVEQNVRQALAIADRGYVIESGRIILEGGSARLLATRGWPAPISASNDGRGCHRQVLKRSLPVAPGHSGPEKVGFDVPVTRIFHPDRLEYLRMRGV